MTMSRIHRISLRAALSLSAVAGVFGSSSAHAQPYTFDTSESSFDSTYATTTISLSGTVTTRTGTAIPNATVTVIAWGAASANNAKTATTTATGTFTITGLGRRSVLLQITAAGYYTEIIPVDLQRPTTETTTSAGTLRMTTRQTGRVRVLFGGDTMFGRRFVDADQDGIEGEAGDLIRPTSRAADAQAIVTYMRNVISAADYSISNLESPVTATPLTPHPYKDYTFWSYPETLAGITYAGIDGVDLANNHMFDYLSGGIADTMSAVPNAGLDWAGIGTSESVAKNTSIFRTLNNVPLSFLGFSEMISDGSTLLDYLLVARDPTKSGALESSTTNLSNFITTELTSSRFAIPMVHGGKEYTDYPVDSMRSKFVSLIGQGAGLVMAHHPHTIHGVGLVNNGTTPKFIMMSLGNLIFEQDVFETFNSYVAMADIDVITGGYDVVRLEVIPFHIENYVPKLVSGDWLARAGRQIGHLSSTLPTTNTAGTTDGLYGATVFPSNGRVIALRSATQYSTATSTQTASLTVTSAATPPLKLTRTSASDALFNIKSSVAATAEYGRDLLLYGDFEDLDVDGDFGEGSAWDQTTARYIENSVTHSGTGAFVLLRNSANASDALAFNKNRVSFPLGAKLTFTGWYRGDTTGAFKAQITQYDSAGTALSTTDALSKTAGTYAWTQFTFNFTAATNATSARIYLRLSKPTTGEARVYFDDLELIEWEGSNTNALAGFNLPSPNNYSWVRYTNVAAGATTLSATLTRKAFTAL